MLVASQSSNELATNFSAALARIGAYFVNESPLQRAATEVAKHLDELGIDYAIAGALSLAAHGLVRATEDVDVLLTLSAPGAAPEGLASTGDPRFNRLWTLMGVPCVNVPGYVAEGGLPVGVQVIARFGDDAGALKAARFVEEALKRS